MFSFLSFKNSQLGFGITQDKQTAKGQYFLTFPRKKIKARHLQTSVLAKSMVAFFQVHCKSAIDFAQFWPIKKIIIDSYSSLFWKTSECFFYRVASTPLQPWMETALAPWNSAEGHWPLLISALLRTQKEKVNFSRNPRRNKKQTH